MPVLHSYTAAYVSSEQMRALSEKLTDPANQDGPYVPTYLNVLHAHLLGVAAAVEIQRRLNAGSGSVSISSVLESAIPAKPERDALIARRQTLLKDGANLATVERFNANTGALLNRTFTRAYKLIKEHFPEIIPTKAEIGSSGSWLKVAQDELEAWKAGSLTEKADPGRSKVLEYFQSTDFHPDKVVAWCGAFIAHCLKESGEPGASSVISGAARAANWKSWGDTKLRLRAEDADETGIPKGAIVVFEPLAPKTSGHVGFFDSLKAGNKISVIGGNQTGGVSLKSINRGKIVAIRWLSASKTTETSGDQSLIAGSPINATAHDVDILARTLYGEARGEFTFGDEAVQAVANVVLNRVRAHHRNKTTIAGVCLDRLQFSCWNGGGKAKLMAVPSSDNELVKCTAVATAAAKGQFPDNTHGALHYHATTIAKPKWVRNSPNARVTLEIGHHLFYTGIEVADPGQA